MAMTTTAKTIKDRYTKAVQFLRLTVTSVLNGIGQVSIEGLLVVQDMPQLEKS